MVSLSYFSIGLAVATFAAQAVNAAPATEEVSHSEGSKHHVSYHRFHHAHREHHGKKSTKAPAKKSTKKPSSKLTKKAISSTKKKAKSTVKLTKKSTKKSSSKKSASKSLTKKATTGSSSTGASGVSSGDVKTILDTHNAYRKEHSAPALTWNTTLASYAQKWSNGCVFKHSGGPYGENLGEGYASWKDVVDAWYSEADLYDYSNPGFSEATGHFSQVVWVATRQIGCGVTTCSSLSGAPLYTCSYNPPGNYLGEFQQNVLEH